jgi:hypothetical protein
MNVLAKINVLVPLFELIKIPSQMDKVRKFLTMEPEDPPIVLQTWIIIEIMEGMHLSLSPW